MRPLYESQKDLGNEREVVERLSLKTRHSFQKLPIKYHLDYARINESGHIVSFIEIKCRREPYETFLRYKTYMISLDKLMKARDMCSMTGASFAIILRTGEGRLFYCLNPKPKHYGIGTNKQRNDQGDVEPCGYIDIADFKEIS